MDYEQLVTRCEQLRARSQRSEVEFFGFLMEAESDYKDVWEGAGCANYHQFLRSNHLCKPERFDGFKRGVVRVGMPDALKNGVSWTIEAGKFEDPTEQMLGSFRARADAFVETEHVAPAEETVREWRHQIDQASKPHATIRKADELSKLRAENQKLKAELRAAESLILELKAELKKKATLKGKQSRA